MVDELQHGSIFPKTGLVFIVRRHQKSALKIVSPTRSAENVEAHLTVASRRTAW